MVQEAKSDAKKNMSDTGHFIDQDPALLVKLISGEPKCITASQKLVLKAMCQTTVLVATRAVGLIEVNPHENVAGNHACKTAREKMDIYPGRPFYITVANLGKVNVHLQKHAKVGELANAPFKVVHIIDEPYSYPSDAYVNKSDRSVNPVHYKPVHDIMEHMAKHEAVKQKDEKNPKKDWHEDVQLVAKFKKHQAAVSEMLKEFESM